MSTSVEPLRRWALSGLVAALVVPLAAAGVTSKEENAASAPVAQPKAKASAKPAAAPPGYRLRCWQEGRLILEETTRDAPPESALDVLRLHDRNGGTLLLLETANATCLLNAATTPPAKPKP